MSKKPSRRQLAVRLIVFLSLLINYLQIQDKAIKWLNKQPVYKRHVISTYIDGLKYRFNKWIRG